MKEIQTNGITILIVEVPEDISGLMSIQENNVLLLWRSDIDYLEIQLPSSQYQIPGKSTEITEEQMKEIVERKDWLWGKMTYLSSYLSLLESNGIVDRNPLDKPNEADILEEHEDWIYARAKYKSLLEQWQEAQSKVKQEIERI